MNSHITSILSGIFAAGAFVGVAHIAPTFKEPPAQRIEVRTQSQKIVRNAWPELEQSRVDALTAALGKIEKRPVTIICANQAWCADLQLDLDNSFESAHWTTSFDTLIFGDQVGITASDEDLAKVVGDATGLSVRLDTSYREHLEQLAKVANVPPERKAQIIIGRNAEK